MRTITDVELALDAKAQLAEGPLWDVERRRLRWIDIAAGAISAFDPSTGINEAVSVGRTVGAIALREGGGLVVAAVGGFFGLADGSCELEPLVAVPDSDSDGSRRMNDGKVDPQGRLWAGSMADSAAPGAGVLHRLDPDGTVQDMLAGLTIPNGLDWSVDNRTMYYIDSPTRRIDAFDFEPETGALANRRPLVTIDGAVLPDGMTVDADGFLWVALWDGWAVHRYAPDGRLDAVVRLPVAQVTSCTFGGADLTELFITTASDGLTEEDRSQQPLAGGLFVCQPGVRGRASTPFGVGAQAG